VNVAFGVLTGLLARGSNRKTLFAVLGPYQRSMSDQTPGLDLLRSAGQGRCPNGLFH
jgi:hypothetical protein